MTRTEQSTESETVTGAHHTSQSCFHCFVLYCTLPIGPIRPSPPKIKFFGVIWCQRPWLHIPKIDFHAKFGRPNQPLLPAPELSAVKSNTIFLHGLVWQTKNLTPKISFWLRVDQKKTLPKNMSYDQSYAQKTNFSHFSFFFNSG